MKFTWEATDIRGGRKVLAHNLTEPYMVVDMQNFDDAERHYILVSLLDGIRATKPMTAAQMAGRLNDAGSLPTTLDWGVTVHKETRDKGTEVTR